MISQSRIITTLAAVCLLLCCAGGLEAQVTTTEILGTVTDPTGGVLQAATVTLKNLGTNVTRSTITTEAGSYLFALLPVGSYQLTIEASGFKTFAVPRITVASGDRTRVDAVMEIGEVTDTVEVSAFSAGAVQTDSATVGTLITDVAIQDLPVNGRNTMALVQLAAGASESVQWSLAGGTRPEDRRQSSAVSVNGITDLANNYLLDGMDNNERSLAAISVRPSIDALQEVQTTTSMYGAEIGRAGGAVVNMITKAGTNDFHGSAFWFVRNDIFDAKDWFNVPQPGNPLAGVKPKYRQNQFGGSIGGPIVQDKTFFFADYERLSINQGETHSVKIPTACQLGRAECNGVTQLGNFSDITNTVFKNPVTGDPLPNNIMPASFINPVGANLAGLYPTLSQEACPDPANCRFISSPERTQFVHTGDVRVDHHFGQNDSLFARYSINNTASYYPGWLPDAEVAGVEGVVSHGGAIGANNFAGSSDQRAQSVAASFTHVFRPNLMLQVNGQFGKFRTDSQPSNADKGNLQDKFGGPANVNSDKYPGTGGMAIILFMADAWAGLGDMGAMPLIYDNSSYQFSGNTIWSKSSHNMKFGGSVIRRQWSFFQNLFKSFMNFDTTRSGNGMINMIAGTYTFVMRDMSLETLNYRSNEFALYFQDDWRATNWLTLNMGVRYDIYTPLREKENHLSNFDITKADVRASGQMSIAGQNGVSDTLGIKTQYGSFQPRFGLAATVRSGTVLRGGFGMSYHPTNVLFPAQLKNAPFTMADASINFALYGVPLPMKTLSDPLPPIQPGATCLSAACGAPPGSSFTIAQATDEDYKHSRIYMWNVVLEQEIAGNVVSVGYLGTSGRNLPRVLGNANQPLPPNGPGGCGIYPVPASCRPYHSELPYVSGVALLKSDGILNYNAFQTTLQRRFNKGLTMQAHYTWGRALSDTLGPIVPSGALGTVQNDRHRDYGNSVYDIRHRFVATANYELPFGKSLSGLAGQLIGGWQLNGIYLRSTGVPFSVTQSENIQGTNAYQGQSTGNRPDVVAPRSDFEPSLDQWIDITQFRRQALGTAGNLGAYQHYMPGMTRVDLSVFKNFRFTESVTLQFRAEFFNLTNTPSFGMPGQRIAGWTTTDITDRNATPTSAGDFARVTSMNANYTPRDIQFALKLLF